MVQDKTRTTAQGEGSTSYGKVHVLVQEDGMQ